MHIVVLFPASLKGMKSHVLLQVVQFLQGKFTIKLQKN